MSGPVEGRRWIVEGRVQGVGFRWFVSQEARRLGLAGWATNLPDGRVEVVARGEPDHLLQLERALGNGPTFARVDNVDKAHVPHEEITANRFDIR